MSLDQILSELRNFDGVLELAPEAGSDHPEISWGDHFFYYAPDGRVPSNRQPYATIVTKNYPDDAQSLLDDAERWRLNIHVGSEQFADLVGYRPESISERDIDFSQTDSFLPHPSYGAYGWVCVVNPGPSTTARALQALHRAHLADQRRVERRGNRPADLGQGG
ncbi:hypothetical protein SAMN04487846_3251 [Microbacterium sp. cf046]|uniref:DUF6194 family protein n=1 Tax=Microbacterium sp. cf046 TaxID=1761803 RepID=UPI0008EAF46A|nr:DUF6194 family protein [Microbacterium sp. cf046]SFS16143.1 hypothetical protein SAMN04487846_3251 [Microbacterium sp. cf046]